MAQLGQFAKLGYVMSAAALAVTASLVHLERGFVYDRGLLRGEERVVAETIGVLLPSKDRPNFYGLFSAEYKTAALEGASATLHGPGVLSDVRFEADSGTVRWSNGRRSHGTAPGLIVRITGHARVPADAAKERDTLTVELPGLSSLADATQHTPSIAPADYTRRVNGARADIRYYDIRDRGSAERRSRNLLLLESTLAVLFALLAVRFVYRLMQ